MTFEFLITYRNSAGTDIGQILCDLLSKVLEENDNEFEEDDVDRMLGFHLERSLEESTNENGDKERKLLIGFTLELPDDTAQIQTVVEEFTSALHETGPITHAVKFEDQLLRKQLAQRAEEIFYLEMKLRRVLSLVYLHAHKHEGSYDLLRDDAAQPMAKERPQPEHMKAAAENQFFHLTFSQYIGLNQRPEIKPPVLLKILRDSDTYDALREEIGRMPIEDKDDTDFLAGLSARMNSIEDMRNCVAHNRRPNKRVVENYENARPLLDELLDEYLARWECGLEGEGELSWDTETRQSVERAIEDSHWDDEARTITFRNDEERMADTVVSNREELEEYLQNVARDTFYAYCARDDGEYIAECDEYYVVERALAPIEDRLEELFGEHG